jgi:hypothetical protein
MVEDTVAVDTVRADRVKVVVVDVLLNINKIILKPVGSKKKKALFSML